ncbi:MAG: hypothetical protein IT303_06265 [Dehalococcoidia bacterium]|nr:hypothetical protein [Dehalococcoidia bacterium]
MKHQSTITEGSTLPAIGERVAATSGRPIGVVIQVRPDCFHVAMPGNDAWLTRDAVFTIEEGVVTLVCEPERLCAYTVIPVGRRTSG